MASHCIARLLASGALLAGASAVLALGGLLAMQGVGRPGVDAWLLAWGLLFVMVMPAGTVVLAAVSTFTARAPIRRTVPNAVRNVPEAGQ